MKYVELDVGEVSDDDLRDLTLVFAQVGMLLEGRAPYAEEYARMLMSICASVGEARLAQKPTVNAFLVIEFLEGAPAAERSLLSKLLGREAERFRQRARVHALELLTRSIAPLNE